MNEDTLPREAPGFRVIAPWHPPVRWVAALPAALVAFRCVVAALLLWDGLDGHVSGWFLPGVLAGFLSEVYDGILARRWGVSTPWLRRADSRADVLFYGCIATAAWLAYRDVLAPFAVPLLVFFATYAAWWVVSLARYGRGACHHAWSAKLWAWSLLAAIVALFGFGRGGVFLGAAIVLGIVNNVENILITCLLPRWTPDVPSVVHALRLRRQGRRPAGGREGLPGRGRVAMPSLPKEEFDGSLEAVRPT